MLFRSIKVDPNSSWSRFCSITCNSFRIKSACSSVVHFVITAAIRLFTAVFEPLLPTGWRVTSIISNLLIILGGVIILRNQAFSTATLTTMVVIVAGFGWIVEGVMSILESELSSNRALAILSGALSIIAGMFVFIYPLWSAKMLVIFSGTALLVFGVTLIVRAIQFGKLVH